MPLFMRDLITIFGQWNFLFLRNIFGHNTVKMILELVPPPPNIKDYWIWAASSFGIFTIKLYNLLDQSFYFNGNPQELSYFWKKLWKSNIHQCHKLL